MTIKCITSSERCQWCKNLPQPQRGAQWYAFVAGEHLQSHHHTADGTQPCRSVCLDWFHSFHLLWKWLFPICIRCFSVLETIVRRSSISTESHRRDYTSCSWCSHTGSCLSLWHTTPILVSFIEIDLCQICVFSGCGQLLELNLSIQRQG